MKDIYIYNIIIYIYIYVETMSSYGKAHQHMRYGTVKPELLTEFDLTGGAGRARLLAGPYADQVIGAVIGPDTLVGWDQSNVMYPVP